MKFNVTIDTNVVLDKLQKREPWSDAADKIFLLVANKKINASINCSSVTDIYYIYGREKGKAIARQAITYLSKLLDFITVDKNDCNKALSSEVDDFEDALLSVCAKKVNAKYIITRDIKDFAKSKVEAITPEEFCESFMKSINGEKLD